MGNRHLLFVYGTLMRGNRNARVLSDADFIGAAVTRECFAMFSAAGAYPAVFAAQRDARIGGELYRVSASDLRACDRIEGHPRLFRRRRVDVLHQKRLYRAWLYLIVSPRGLRPAEAEPQIERRGDMLAWKTDAKGFVAPIHRDA